jgi:hypothetical protein
MKLAAADPRRHRHGCVVSNEETHAVTFRDAVSKARAWGWRIVTGAARLGADTAEDLAQAIAAATGVEADSWIKTNAQMTQKLRWINAGRSARSNLPHRLVVSV